MHSVLRAGVLAAELGLSSVVVSAQAMNRMRDWWTVCKDVMSFILFIVSLAAVVFLVSWLIL